MAPPTEPIYLANQEDWQQWIEYLESITDEDVWPHIDPEAPDPATTPAADEDEDENEDEAEDQPPAVPPLLTMPARPTIREYEPNAATYAQMTAAPRKAYDVARKYYDQDTNLYNRQRDHMKALRKHILNHVSPEKRLFLTPKLSLRQWLVMLMEDTKPSPVLMRQKAQQQYDEALKPLRQQSKIGQWLNQWEHAMQVSIKYKLRQIDDGVWLQDIARAIKPFSESLYTKYISHAGNPKKNESTRYRKVATELRQVLEPFTKKGPSTGTMRGSAFNVDFAGETEDGNSAGEGTTAGPSRKRAGTTSLEKEAPDTKKQRRSTCPACERKGHSLSGCWYLFEDKRPERFKASAKRLKETLERVKNNKDLAAQVKKLRLERGEAVEVDEA